MQADFCVYNAYTVARAGPVEDVRQIRQVPDQIFSVAMYIHTYVG